MSQLHNLNLLTSEHQIKIQRGLFCLLSSDKNQLAFYFDSYSLPEKGISSQLEIWKKENPQSSAKLIGHTSHLKNVEVIFKAKQIEIEKKVERDHIFEVLFFPKEKKLQVSKNDLKASELQKKYNSESTATHVKNEKIKVLIVDDSATIRNLLSKVFTSDPLIEVVAMAENPLDVEDLIRKHHPDVITLDIHMPQMDGLTLLKKYLQHSPIPTIMISSISMEEGPMVLSALENGAVDYIQKPSLDQLKTVAPLMIEKIKIARNAKVNLPSASKKIEAKGSRQKFDDKNTIIAIGSSTGGTEALRNLFSDLPDEIPPILVVQHIPPVFSKAFADRLNSMFAFTVKEASDGDAVLPNQVLIAPGGTQMKVVGKAGQLKVLINDDAPVNRHKPSVDYMFNSLAEIEVPIISVILTGMGGDGAKGMALLKKNGSRTIAQNEETSIVFGMPKEAIKLGCVDQVEPLENIAPLMVQWLQKGHKKSA